MELNNLRLIEIELFSYCNRRCLWCPNHYIERNNSIDYLDTNIFINLIDELTQNKYTGFISFSRYNEPLSQIYDFKYKLRYIKTCLPEATLVTNTNGDFLTRQNLHGLLIDELTVMDYDCQGLSYCIGRLAGCGCTIDSITPQYIRAHYNTMKILYCVNWPDYASINDRGGSLPEYSTELRTRPCFEPQYFIGVNYDGTVSPCCNIRNDIQEHKEYIIGDLKENTLSEILHTDKYHNFVNMCAIADYTEKSPCTYCQNNGGRYTRDKGGIDYE